MRKAGDLNVLVIAAAANSVEALPVRLPPNEPP